VCVFLTETEKYFTFFKLFKVGGDTKWDMPTAAWELSRKLHTFTNWKVHISVQVEVKMHVMYNNVRERDT
jgi:hypothetical protein